MHTHAKKGFSLIETLGVLAIILVLTTVTIQAFIDTQRTHALDKAALTAMSVLEQARAKSVGSYLSSRYGVYFATSTITTFNGATYNPNDSTNNVQELSSYVQMQSLSLNGGGNTVVFGRVTGTTTSYGTVTYALNSSSTQQKTIRIHQTGIIELDQ
jgi:prepilin-type N-terminal cleavage/methylation domain-containing protein